MKPTRSALLSLISLAGLLSGLAHAQVALSPLPLKPSVYAKPAVIFGVDDSGSMDWEILVNAQSGMGWWDGTQSWITAQKRPVQNPTGNLVWISDSRWGSQYGTSGAAYGYGYVFALGINTNSQLYGMQSGIGVAPPITGFEWMRSAAYNPQYYNPMVTYERWVDAPVNGTMTTFTDASPAAARIHPLDASVTFDLTRDFNASSPNWGAQGWEFFVSSGMRLPAGSFLDADANGVACVGSNGGGSRRTLTADTMVGATRSCFAAIPYYPATYWHPVAASACTLGPNCIADPNGDANIRLRRYEIRSGNSSYPSGRTYAAEIQNFANWFQYYRKRKLGLGASMGQVLRGLSNMRLGSLLFSQTGVPAMYDADGSNPLNNRFALADPFYRLAMTARGTPTHTNMLRIGDAFASNNASNPALNPVQLSCQRNAMFVVTDGFANNPGTITVPTYSAAPLSAGAPYQTTPANSLSDIALAYYSNNLRPDLPAGRVPVNPDPHPSADKNPDLHVNTYALTLGVYGKLWPAGGPNGTAIDPYVTAPTWPGSPVFDTPDMVDDLWHATINGRGQMYLASNPADTAASIRRGLNHITAGRGSQAGVGVANVNMVRSDGRAYLGVYNPAGWSGDFVAKAANLTTGAVSGADLFSASALLKARAASDRIIVASTGSGTAVFNAAGVGAIVNPSAKYGTNADVVNFLRGDTSQEGTLFRERTGPMGAVVNAEVAVDPATKVAYMASGDGMLHAFDIDATQSDSGKELWAYVPYAALSDMGAISSKSYQFRSRLDGTPTLAKTGGTTMLFSGMGIGGKGYFAIDVGSPRPATAAALQSMVKWNFPSASDSTNQGRMGYTYGRASLVKLADNTEVLLVSSGYNTPDGRGRLWVLNPTTGAVLSHTEVAATDTATSEAGLTHLAPFLEIDGTVRYVYAGDLKGRLWVFDLGSGATATPTVRRLTTLTDSAGNAQPITSEPELALVQGRRTVYVGTGRLLAIGDFDSTSTRTLWAISDGSTITSPRSSLQALSRSGTTITASPAINWATKRGWYVDIPAGEQVVHRPSLAWGKVAFVSNTASQVSCGATSKVYVVDAASGVGSITTISNDSGASSPQIVVTKTGLTVVTRKNEPKCADGSLTCDTHELTLAGAGVISAAKNSWRDVRR